MPGAFDAKAIARLAETKYVKIRAGVKHRFINIWIAVVDGRVFARSWNNKPAGRFAALLTGPEGAVVGDGRPLPVTARKEEDANSWDAVSRGFGRK